MLLQTVYCSQVPAEHCHMPMQATHFNHAHGHVLLLQLMALRKRMTELSIKFSECLAESIVTRSFTKAELQGMSADYIAGLKPDKQAPGKLIVTTKYPDYYPLMRNCKVGPLSCATPCIRRR